MRMTVHRACGAHVLAVWLLLTLVITYLVIISKNSLMLMLAEDVAKSSRDHVPR